MNPTTGSLLAPRAWHAVRRALAAAVLLAAFATPLHAQEPAPSDSAQLPVPAVAPHDAPEDATALAPAAGADSGAAAAPITALNPRAKVGARRVRLVASSQNVARSGPGEDYAIVGVYPKKSEFTVIAKRGEWYGVRLSESETGWFHASLCRESDDMSDLEFKPNPKLFTRTGSFALTGYSGAYAFDRKSNSLVVGGRLGYYVFDRLVAEGGVAWTRIRRPQEIVESLFDLSLEAEDFHMLFYQLGLTWEVLPGRQMVPFVTGGVGSSIMQGRSESSVNVGAGTTLFLSRRMAMRWEVRDYSFKSGSDDARRTNHNVEFTLGTTLLF
jgi:outer membrane beta-barrel protein